MIKSVWVRRTTPRRFSKKRLLSVEVFYQSGRKWSDKIGCSLDDLLPTVPPIFTCFCLKTLPSLGPISFFWPKFCQLSSYSLLSSESRVHLSRVSIYVSSIQRCAASKLLLIKLEQCVPVASLSIAPLNTFAINLLICLQIWDGWHKLIWPSSRRVRGKFFLKSDNCYQASIR